MCPMTKERAYEILKEAGVLLEGHFLLTSGRHSNRYLQCARIFRNTRYSEELCAALAEKFRDAGVDIVIGPALGAVQMAYEVSRALGCRKLLCRAGGRRHDVAPRLRHPTGAAGPCGGGCRHDRGLGTGSVGDCPAGRPRDRRCRLDRGPHCGRHRFRRAVPFRRIDGSRILGTRRMPSVQSGAPAPYKPGSRKS